jgi:hypothetical protein
MSEQVVIAVQIDERVTPRARRFAMPLPIRYRVQAQTRWCRGETVNVSSSGVLFRGDCFAETKTLVELNLVMPAVNSEGTAEVVCRGKVVRTLAALRGVSEHLLAVRISQYRLVRP